MDENSHLTITDFRKFLILPKKYQNEKTWLHVVGVAFSGPKGSAIAVHVEDSDDKNIYRALVDRDTAMYLFANEEKGMKIKFHKLLT